MPRRVPFHCLWRLSLLQAVSRWGFCHSHCYVHVQALKTMRQRDLLLLLRALSAICVTATRSAALFFVPAALRSSPVQLGAKLVPFPFWMYSEVWLLNLASLAVWGRKDVVPPPLLNDRRPRTCNIYIADKQCKEYSWHQTWIRLWPIHIHTYSSGREQISSYGPNDLLLC